jgi:hypothetical protein
MIRFFRWLFRRYFARKLLLESSNGKPDRWVNIPTSVTSGWHLQEIYEKTYRSNSCSDAHKMMYGSTEVAIKVLTLLRSDLVGRDPSVTDTIDGYIKYYDGWRYNPKRDQEGYRKHLERVNELERLDEIRLAKDNPINKPFDQDRYNESAKEIFAEFENIKL